MKGKKIVSVLVISSILLSAGAIGAPAGRGGLSGLPVLTAAAAEVEAEPAAEDPDIVAPEAETDQQETEDSAQQEPEETETDAQTTGDAEAADGQDQAAEQETPQDTVIEAPMEEPQTDSSGSGNQSTINAVPVGDPADEIVTETFPSQDSTDSGQTGASVTNGGGYVPGSGESIEYAQDQAQPGVRVDFGSLAAGDRIIIVFENARRTISTMRTGQDLTGTAVMENQGSLTYVPDNTAVFTLGSDGADGYTFHTDAGYLTCTSDGGLILSQDAVAGSSWQIRDGGIMACAGTEAPEELMVAYDRAARSFTTSAGSEQQDASVFSMSFYRLDASFSLPADDGTGFRLPVFETSDLQGTLTDTEDGQTLYRLAYIADRVNDVRGTGQERRLDTAVLLDGGNIFRGNDISDLTGTDYVSRAMEAMGYDAVTVGDQEFVQGIETVIDDDATLVDFGTEADGGINEIPVVLSNLYKNGNISELTEDFVILEKTAADGQGQEIPVRIGVIGFAADYSSLVPEADFAGAGYTINEDFARLNSLAADLKSREGCQAVIVLAHGDAPYVAGYMDAGTSIDLVLGGHMQVNDCGANGRGLTYMMPAGQGRAYASAELVFETDENGQVVLSRVAGAKTVALDADPSLLTGDGQNGSLIDETIVGISDEAAARAQEIMDEEAAAAAAQAAADAAATESAAVEETNAPAEPEPAGPVEMPEDTVVRRSSGPGRGLVIGLLALVVIGGAVFAAWRQLHRDDEDDGDYEDEEDFDDEDGDYEDGEEEDYEDEEDGDDEE